MKKRLFAVLASLCMVVSMVPTMAFAQDSGAAIGAGGLCEHHTEHTSDCGYTEGTPEQPCAHEHTDECYAVAGQCVHTAHDESCGGLADPTVCTHVCGEDTGCVIKTLNCQHQHDESCGYVPATEGTPCTFVCEVCNVQDSGNPAAPSDAQPEECTCETLCTGEEINGDCPVCSAEGADLSACKGAVSMPLRVQRNVENIPYLDENGTQQTAASATQVTNSDTQWTDGWYVAQSNITIDGTVTISGNVHLILEDGCNLTVNGGILLQSDSQSDSNMYIYAQSTEKERMGSLTATGTDAGFKEAGYGTQTLTIAGGKISASGSDEGISAVNLIITDGYVSALGTDLYGDSIAVYNATISGGFVDLYGDFTGTLSTGIDGHAVISSTGEIKNIAADCKGFFLIQKTGKIYGDTFTLTQDLNIANSNIVVTVEEGQTLTLDDGVTLTIPVIATLTNNGIVNNNGTIINTGTLNNSGTLNNNGNLNNTSVLNNAGSIINNGTLTGEVGGSGTVTPKITTDSPLPEGTVGESYTATLEATGNNITWSASGLPDGLTLNESTGTISGTPTTADTYTFTVTATNASGSDSKEFTLTISEPAPITYTITADVDPAGAGIVSGGGNYTEGTSVTLTATPNSGYRFVEWMENGTRVSTDASYSFAAISNRNLTAKFEQVYTVTVHASAGGTATADKTAAAAGEIITLTATPDSGYHFAGWSIVSGSVTIQNNQFIMPAGNVEIQAVFDRNSSSGGSDSSYTQRQEEFWDGVKEQIRDADPGDTIKVNARSYDRLPYSVMKLLGEQDDVTLRISWDDGDPIEIPSAFAANEPQRVYYPLEELAEMDFTRPAEPGTDKTETETSVGAGTTTGTTGDTSGSWTGGTVTQPAESQPETEEPDSEPESEPETEPESEPTIPEPDEETMTEPERGELPMSWILGGAVIVIAVGSGGFWFWKRKPQD